METKSLFVFTIVFGYLLGSSFAATCFDSDLSEICGTSDPVVPQLLTRGPGIFLTDELFLWEYCDVLAIDRGQWYYSKIPMTTTCPEMYRCGTVSPIWLQGRSPVQNGGIVNTTACLRELYNCCGRLYSIAAVNCGYTLAYCFNELPDDCHQRYCFGEDFNETTLQTTRETTLQTTRETTLQTTPETTLHTTSETNRQTTPETTLQTTPETTLQTTPETTLQTTPETTLQTTPETTLQPNPETTLQTTPETTLQTTKQPTGKKESDTIIILVACLCVLLSAVIVLSVVIIRRRRAKQSKTSDKSLDRPDKDERIPKTVDVGREYQAFGEHVHYESLNNFDKIDFLGTGYASLKQHVSGESEGNMKYLRQHEVIFDARLAVINTLYERPAIVLGEYEVPNPTKEEDHYETLP